MTTPKPPKGRRWLDGGQLLFRTDLAHGFDSSGNEVSRGRTVFPGHVAISRDHIRYSRAIRRKTTRE